MRGGWALGIRSADGSDPQYLFPRFISQSDINLHLDQHRDNWDRGNPGDEYRAFKLVKNFFGPMWVTWSPQGNRIAFTATIPFDPYGLWVSDQMKVWVFDLDVPGGNPTRSPAGKPLWRVARAAGCPRSALARPSPLRKGLPGRISRIALMDHRVWWLSWKAGNTSASHPTATVNNTTVAFSSVTGEGLTTIIRDDDPPALPTGYQFCGEYYEINTTAPHSGVITITMTYKEVPGGDEGVLVLLHFSETTQQWEDITTERDTDENWVKGVTDSLSLFGFGLRLPVWVSPLGNGTSEAAPAGPFKRGRTIPVKFRLNGANGQPLSDADAAALHPELQVFYDRASAEGVPVETGEGLPDVGAEFRYDAENNLFIYNLSTKDRRWLANYTYGLEVLIGSAKAGEVFFSLR